MNTICPRCLGPVRGFATINGERFCHPDIVGRTCYTEESYERTMARRPASPSRAVLFLFSALVALSTFALFAERVG